MKKEIQTILVTGSSGMIGTALCDELISQGYTVIGFDRRANQWNEIINRQTIRGDLLVTSDKDKIPEFVDMVVHLAANAGVFNSIREPSLAQENVETTCHILEWMRLHSVSRFVFASSGEVYGNISQGNRSEQGTSFADCHNPYAASKAASEAFAQAYRASFGMGVSIIRLSNVFGMYDTTARVIPSFFALSFKKQPLVVYGKDKVLDFVHIRDCIKGIMAVINDFEHTKNDVYNIASGDGKRLSDIALRIQTVTHNHSTIRIEKSRKGEVDRFVADISKAKEKLGYYPKKDFITGLQEAKEWYEKVYGQES